VAAVTAKTITTGRARVYIVKLVSAAVGVTVVASALAVAAASPARAAPAAAGAWGNARTIPGLAALAKGGHSGVSAASCASPGNCVADGTYLDGKKHSQVFVADERNGHWGNAIEVPGLGALNKGDAGGLDGEDVFVSCAPKVNLNCAAAGAYQDSTGKAHLFVADEENRHWGNAIEIPNLGHLNSGDAAVFALACGSAGICTVGGYYDGPGKGNGEHSQGFIADEKGGRWGNARAVPGLAALNTGQSGEADSVSCPTGGNCTVVGSYSDAKLISHSFAADEKNGIWGPAREIPGTQGLSNSAPVAVSCASAGNCSATGAFLDGHGKDEVFVAAESGGMWRPAAAKPLPHFAALNTGRKAGGAVGAMAISCRSAGGCATTGIYLAGPAARSYVADEKDGTWRNAAGVTGFAAFSKATEADVQSLSCGAMGFCSSGGFYIDSNDRGSAFLVSENAGTWGKAIAVPGLAALNKGQSAIVSATSCAAANQCLAGGTYTTTGNHSAAFVVSQS
jgi:hypothetical protein